MNRNIPGLGNVAVGLGTVRLPPSGGQDKTCSNGQERVRVDSVWVTNPADEIRERLSSLRRLEGIGAPFSEIEKARDLLRAGLNVVDVRDLTIPHNLYTKAQAAALK
jgi:hypothetical protein